MSNFNSLRNTSKDSLTKKTKVGRDSRTIFWGFTVSVKNFESFLEIVHNDIIQNSKVSTLHFETLNPSQIKTSKFWARYHKLTLAKSCSTKCSGVHGAASLSRIQIGRLLQEEKILFCILKRRLHTSNHLPLTTGKHHKKGPQFQVTFFWSKGPLGNPIDQIHPSRIWPKSSDFQCWSTPVLNELLLEMKIYIDCGRK